MAKVEEDTTVKETTIKKEERREERPRKTHRRGELIVVDLGKKRWRDVRDLRKGKGRLMDDVDEVIDELQDAGTIREGAEPVVIVVERRVRGVVVPVLLPPGLPGLLPTSLSGRDDDDQDRDDDDEDDEDEDDDVD